MDLFAIWGTIKYVKYLFTKVSQVKIHKRDLT